MSAHARLFPVIPLLICILTHTHLSCFQMIPTDHSFTVATIQQFSLSPYNTKLSCQQRGVSFSVAILMYVDVSIFVCLCGCACACACVYVWHCVFACVRASCWVCLLKTTVVGDSQWKPVVFVVVIFSDTSFTQNPNGPQLFHPFPRTLRDIAYSI